MVERYRGPFFKGFLLTLTAAVLVPVFADIVLAPAVDDLLGDMATGMISGPIITTVVLWLCILALMTRMSGIRILREYGLSGVLGIIAAYWYLGNTAGALLPLLSIIVAVAWARRFNIRDRLER